MSTSALSVKQRRFVAAYVSSGNGTQAALAAYDTDDPRTAHAIASENLRKPAIQDAVGELLEAEGLSDEKLLAIHAHYLGLCASENPRLKAIGLKALDMAYRLKGAYAPERHRIEAEHVPAEALERVALVLRELHEFEHPGSPSDSGRVSDSRRYFVTAHGGAAAARRQHMG
jgi:hypothetical protein